MLPSSDNLFEFACTIAILALVAVPYGIALRRIGSTPLRNVVLGILLGFTAVGAMLHPVALEPGSSST